MQLSKQSAAWSILIVAGVVAGVVKLSAKRRRSMAVAPSIDLAKYAGTWYEIARLPNRFERKCDRDVTATYSLRPDGRIDVLNRCRRSDERISSIRGTARPLDPAGPNTKLNVTFFWPFAGDYWILDIDPEYRWALIGEPARRYLWILAREPRLAGDVIDRLLERAKSEGYDVTRVLRTPQSALHSYASSR
ncbi:MAG TPA: lipocalin family protein [Bryobacteraceae bacterium]|nr:lipocalin family protein [Bryobacteraceae bacterium]